MMPSILGLTTRKENTARGASSPAKAAKHLPLPQPTTSAATTTLSMQAGMKEPWHPRWGEGMPSPSPRSPHRFLLFFFEEEPGFEASMASDTFTSSRNLFSSRGVRVGVPIKAMNSSLTLLRRTFHALRASFASASPAFLFLLLLLLVLLLLFLLQSQLEEELDSGVVNAVSAAQ